MSVKAYCKACGRDMGLRLDGTFRLHRNWTTGATCSQSHHIPPSDEDTAPINVRQRALEQLAKAHPTHFRTLLLREAEKARRR